MIECRGRNGWFILHQAKVERLDLVREGHVAVSMRSRAPYLNVAPIYFRGPRAEVLKLLEQLLKEVQDA
jgi:hypothetical protein